MTNTLCIETSSAYCSVALACDGEIHGDIKHLERTHNEHVLGMLDAVFGQANVAVADVDVIGFGCGPGSFTGVRIAAAVVQAVAVAADARVVPVPSSKVWVASTRQASEAREWLCGVRSRGEAYYLARYRVDGEEITEVMADVLYESWPENVDVPLDSSAFAGDVPPWLPEEIASLHVTSVPDAAAFLDLVSAAHEQGASMDAELALPSYVRGDSPWRAIGA